MGSGDPAKEPRLSIMYQILRPVMTKIVYQTDAAGLYAAPAEAALSPLEPGVYLIPAGCVEVSPPDAMPNHVRQWAGNAWEQVPDHRGETWYLGIEAVIIKDLGNPAEMGLSQSLPAPTFEDLRVAKIAAISASANALLAAGAPATGGLHVALDDGSRADLTAMAATATAASAGAISWPESYSRGWVTIENVRIPLATPADGLALAASVGDWYAAVIQHRRDLKDAALAAEDAAALDAIDVTTGWPG